MTNESKLKAVLWCIIPHNTQCHLVAPHFQESGGAATSHGYLLAMTRLVAASGLFTVILLHFTDTYI